ncbi:sensor histidine kinase [Streptomyces sp. GESEQ-4]|uniref:sensor histidine kinase n=1 Tax=Streptomyces sp. GESEQ-4 TaxID=2812655 RepID=UPI001B331877|nr:sensor histidine kinase [Streptomyces sp. GESEQ-4]
MPTTSADPPVRMRRPVLLIGLAGLVPAAAAGCTALAVTGGMPAIHAGLIIWIAVSYSAAGLVAWWHRPAGRIGPLMLLAGVTTFLSALTWSGDTAVQTVGQLFDLLPMVVILHLFLAFPAGRLTRRPTRLLVGLGYLAAAGAQPMVMMLGGFGPDHPLRLVDAPGAARVLYDGELIAISVLSLAGVALLAARRWADGRPLRRSLGLLIDSFGLALVMIAVLLLVGVFGGPPFPPIQRVSLAVIGLAPVAFLAGLLGARLARTAVAGLVMELRAEPDDLRAPLARALGDPSLMLVYWLPEFASWADQDGKPLDLPAGPGRATTLIERDGAPVAALVHDAALTEERELLDAVGAAAAIALETGRLQAELRAHVDELRGSRARVIEAGQKERQRLERDLHDGAQQRLIALSLDLAMLETSLGGAPAARARLSQARGEIATSLAELRDVARGLHPAVLSAHGLAVALESLAARAPVPVRLTVRLDGRLAEAVEVAAYYVVCESLANIGKHARATTATVSVAQADGRLVVEVLDDGRGGADTEGGSGLRGLADRVEALGGRLRVWTSRGTGTRVEAELPCG